MKVKLREFIKLKAWQLGLSVTALGKRVGVMPYRLAKASRNQLDLRNEEIEKLLSYFDCKECELKLENPVDKLYFYFITNKITGKEFAIKAEINPNTYATMSSRLFTNISPKNAKKIEKATDGFVKESEWRYHDCSYYN